MKKTAYIIIFIVISILNSFAQKDKSVISVPHMDSSPFNFKITNLWTGKTNYLIADWNVIRIWTDNGSIDTGSYFYGKYSIKPLKNGKVNIYTWCKLVSDNKIIDTIKTVTSFIAINQPNIITIIDKKILKDSLDIVCTQIFADTKKSIGGTRYQVGAFPLPIKISKDSSVIGEIFVFTEDSERKELLKNGNIIHIPSYLIRDMKTDLTFGTSEFDYKYK